MFDVMGYGGKGGEGVGVNVVEVLGCGVGRGGDGGWVEGGEGLGYGGIERVEGVE